MKKSLFKNYSVILPLCDSANAEWLEQSIKSVLNQTVKTNDFIVTLDGNINDNLQKILDKYKNKIRIVKNKKIGLANVLKDAVLKCKNTMVARIDSDDYWDKYKIEKQLKYLENNPKVVLLGTDVYEIENDKKISRINLPNTHNDIVKFSKYRNPYRHSAVMFDKDVIIKVGNYQEYLNFEDYDLWLRIIMNGYKVDNLKQPLTYFRVNNDFYKRRGGIKYIKSMIKFRKKYYRLKYFSFTNYIIGIIGHSLVCLFPGIFRRKFYNKFLRKNV